MAETLVIGQSGGCTAAMNSSLAGVIEGARACGVARILGMRRGVQGLLAGEVVDLTDFPDADLGRLAHTPAAALGSCRHKLSAEEADRLVDLCARRNIGHFLYIGGNDSAETTHQVHAAARKAGATLNAVAIPKTIDNDLAETDHCPGYGSAARFLAIATADAGRDTESMAAIEPVKVIEVMGRNAGWLACASALAKRDDRDAPQIVWPPELPFDMQRFLDAIRAALDGVGHAVAVVPERLEDSDGNPVATDSESASHDGFAHTRPTGAAAALCNMISERLSVRARWDKPGTIQRMSSAHLSEPDLAEARMAGRAAVKAATDGASDIMITLVRTDDEPYTCGTGTAPLSHIAGVERLMPQDHFDADRLLPANAFMQYALPLVGPGLPRHTRL